MKRDPLIVAPNDSLLSVSSAMTDLECHGYALVADKDKKLLGILSSGDILDRMMVLHSKDDFDA
jgi:CBS domain-containing protein